MGFFARTRSPGRALLVAIAGSAQVALLCACELRVHLGREASAADGGTVVDAGAATDAGIVDAGFATEDITVLSLEVTPAVASQAQRGLGAVLRVRNVGPRDAAILLTPSFDAQRPEPLGFTVRAASDTPPILRAFAAVDVRFEITAQNAEGTVPADAEHTFCVALDAHDAATRTPLRVSGAVKCAPLTVQRPAQIEAILKAPAIVYQGEAREVVLQLVNTGSAAAESLRISPDVRAEARATVTGVSFGQNAARPPPDRITGGTTHVVSLLLRVEEDAEPQTILVTAPIRARDANDGSRTLGATPQAARVEVRPIARVLVRETWADRANVRPGDVGIVLGAKIRNEGLGLARLSAPRLRVVDSSGADATSLWTIETPPDLSDDALAAGAERVLTTRLSLRAEAAERFGEHSVDLRLSVQTDERPEVTGTTPAAAQAWRFNVVPADADELEPADYAEGDRFGEALALLNDPEEGPAVFVVGAPGSGRVHVFVAPAQPLPPLLSPGAPATFGAALAGVGRWETPTPLSSPRVLALGAPAQDAVWLIDPVARDPSPSPIPEEALRCAGCALGATLAANPRGVRGATLPDERLLLALGAPGAEGAAGRVTIVWQPGPLEDTVRDLAYTIVAGRESERAGAALAVADLDGDGDAEVIVGAPEHRASGDASARGRVFVLRPPAFATASSTAWAELAGESAGERFGAALASAGDVDGDGADDLIVGAPGATIAGVAGTGRVTLVSGATGERLAVFDGRAWPDASGARRGEGFGAAVSRLTTQRGSATIDFNGDGHPDIAVGAPNASAALREQAGAVYIVSAPPAPGLAGVIHMRLDGIRAGEAYGSSLSHLGDNDGDGFADLVVGAPNGVARGRSVQGGRAERVGGVHHAPIFVSPRIDFVAFDDGASGEPPRRFVTRGGPPVRVRIVLRNSGDAPLANVVTALTFTSEAGLPGAIDGIAVAPAAPPPTAILRDDTATFDFDVGVRDDVAPGVVKVGVRADSVLGTTELPESARHEWIIERPAELRVLALRVTRGNTERGFLSLGRGGDAELAADVLNSGDASVRDLTGRLELLRTDNTPPRGVSWVAEPLPATTRLGFGDAVSVRFRLSATEDVASGEAFSVRSTMEGIDANTSLSVASPPSAQAQNVVTSRATLAVTSLSVPPTVRAGETFSARIVVVYPLDERAAPGATLFPERLELAFSRGNGWNVLAPRPLASIAMCESTVAASCAGMLFESRVLVPLAIEPGAVNAAPRFGALDPSAHPLAVYVEGAPDLASFPSASAQFVVE